MIFRGHDEAWGHWREALTSNRMHHAWILAGREGIGKGHFARAAAAELVAEPGMPQPAIQQHPDIIVLDHLPANETEEAKRADGKPWQARRNITIDQIRRMQQRLTTRPTLGNRRVVIVDPADDMEKNAVNALLKSLEEPPSGTYFILVAHRPGRLLPTIRSRCRILRFAPLPDAEVDAVLRAEAPQADQAARIAAVTAAEGSPGTALAFIDEKLGEIHRIMRGIITEGDPQLSFRGALAEEIGARPGRDRMAAVIELARAMVSGAVPDAGRERQLRLIEAHVALTRLSAQAPTFNFDPGLLALEIGGLLAAAAMPREAAS